MKETDQFISQNDHPCYFDHVICATGYRTGLDKLLPSASINHDGSTHDIPGLHVFGMTAKIQGSIYARLDEAEKLARQIAKFPQGCMRSDRDSACQQWDLPFKTAMANEFEKGLEVVRSGETFAGASRFAGGEGRHGSFDKFE